MLERIDRPLVVRERCRGERCAVALAVDVGAIVDQKSTAFGRGERLRGFELFDPGSCRVEEFFQCSPVRADSHE